MIKKNAFYIKFNDDKYENQERLYTQLECWVLRLSKTYNLVGFDYSLEIFIDDDDFCNDKLTARLSFKTHEKTNEISKSFN